MIFTDSDDEAYVEALLRAVKTHAGVSRVVHGDKVIRALSTPGDNFFVFAVGLAIQSLAALQVKVDRGCQLGGSDHRAPRDIRLVAPGRKGGGGIGIGHAAPRNMSLVERHVRGGGGGGVQPAVPRWKEDSRYDTGMQLRAACRRMPGGCGGKAAKQASGGRRSRARLQEGGVLQTFQPKFV